MKNNCCISVIVPVYNVKDYVKDCLESLEKQTFRDFEVILIDDGSTDGSEDICLEMKKRSERIRYYRKDNGGLSDARNYGLKLAGGEFITFIDSDDYVHPRFLEKLYDACQKTHAELSICFYVAVADDGCCHTELCEETGNIEEMGRRDILRLLCSSGISTSFEVATCKLYYRRLFEHVQFLVGKQHEDTATTYKLYDQIDSAAVVFDKLYCYRQRKGSITHVFSKKSLDILDILRNRQEYYETLGDSQLALLHYQYYLNCVCRMRSEAYHDKVVYELLDKKYGEMIEDDRFFRLPYYKKLKYIIAGKCSRAIDCLLRKKYRY